MNREPVRIIAAIEAVLMALVGLAAYLFSWEGELTGLVVALVSACVVLLGSVFVRSKVTPV